MTHGSSGISRTDLEGIGAFDTSLGGHLEFKALDAARAGRCFGELCEQLSAAQAARLLHDWVTAGLIIAASVAARAGKPARRAAR